MFANLFLTLHLLAVVVWVGGMFFAWMVLRPVAAAQLEPPQRLKLWSGCFDRFFVWVWLAVVLLPLTGYSLIFASYGGMAATPIYVHLMQLLGGVMIAIYLYLWFGPYQALKQAVAASSWPAGGAALATIRRLVGINLLLGLLTIVVVFIGRTVLSTAPV